MFIRNSLVHSQEAHSPCVHILLKKKKRTNWYFNWIQATLAIWWWIYVLIVWIRSPTIGLWLVLQSCDHHAAQVVVQSYGHHATAVEHHIITTTHGGERSQTTLLLSLCLPSNMSIWFSFDSLTTKTKLTAFLCKE